MRRGNVLSGGAFKSASASLIVFILVLTVLGGAVYTIVSSGMRGVLEAQIVEESDLLAEIFQRNGLQALKDTIVKPEKSAFTGNRAIGLFDASGNKIAGNIDQKPGFLGWRTQTFEALLPRLSGTYRLRAQTLDGTERRVLVVGADYRLIQKMQELLILALALSGLAVTLLSILIGYRVSSRVFQKLEVLSRTLEKISFANSDSRVPISEDYDQIDRISEQINKHLDRLSIVTTATKNTINSIAHDLRSPLNRAILELQTLSERKSSDDGTQAALEVVSAELRNITDIFDAILRISKIETLGGGKSFVRVDLKNLLSELQETYEPVLEEANQSMQWRISKNDPEFIFGDRSMLFQLLANLIENFSKYSPAGCELNMTSKFADNGLVMLTVGDNGPGIPENLRDEMLKPFHRMETSRSTTGNGLGLALVNAIIIHHGGNIPLSDNNPGLRIDLQLPENQLQLAKLTKK